MLVAIEELQLLNPGYVSVTYGAAGSNREGVVEVDGVSPTRTVLEWLRV